MLSIVIPARNEGKFIWTCLESLRRQEFDAEYEIIVVDNGSVDNTAEIAASLGATVVYEPKPGVIMARQTGAGVAAGDIIIQADADTIYPRDWLRRIDRFFQTHPEHTALTGAYDYLQPVWWAGLETVLRNMVNGIAVIVSGVPLYVSGANLAFRRNTWLQIGRYDINSFQPDQYGIVHQLHKFGRVKYDPRLIVHTSHRRIDKPALVLWRDVIRNLFRAVSHYFSYLFNSIKAKVS
jgi:peptidoglycan-N-acetylglucosamine deacetylase